MVTRGALTDAMAIGYRPVCESKAGLWPCYPIMPRFGLMGLGMLTGRYTYGLGAVTNPVIPRYGLSGLTFDGTGLLGTGLFSGDMSTWDGSEWMILLIGVPLAGLMVYSTLHQAGQTKLRAQSALKRRRRSKASRLRAKAKRLEEKEGFFGGLFA